MHALAEAGCWQASLGLRFTRRDGKTLLVDRRHQGPVRVQRPFYPEHPKICHVYLLHPPGGLVSGDRITVDIQVDTAAWALLTTPGASKFYRSNGQQSVSQKQHIQVEKGAVVEWLPQEAILFDGAHADIATRIDMHADAHFIGWEITCLGRPASAAPLEQGDICQRFELWQDAVPLWLERARYAAPGRVFSAAWGLRGYSVLGTLVCNESDPALVSALRAAVSVGAEALFSVSQLQGVLVCRYLGHHAEEAKQSLKTAWQTLRPLVLDAPAITPRIWNT